MNRLLKRIAALLTAVSVTAAMPCFAYGATYTSDINTIGDQLRGSYAQRLSQDTLLFKTQEKQLRKSTLNNEFYKVTDDPYEGDYLRYTVTGIEYQVADLTKSGSYYHFLIRAVLKYTTTAEQQQAVMQYADEKSAAFGFTFMDSEFYRVRTIYDYLKADIVYDESAGDTAYDAASGTADSKGIAMLAYAMFKKAGISTRIVSGSGHYWNIVKIGEQWYNIDLSTDEEGCFLTGDETFKNLYERDMDSTHLESCPSDYVPSEEVFDLGITNDPSTGKLIIAWNRIEGATYKVYRNTSPGVTDTEGDEPFLETSDSSFTDTEGTAGRKYYYIIKAEKDGVTYTTVERYRCVDLAAPAAKSALLSSKIKVTWTKVSGVKKYYVYRSTSPDSNFKLVKTTTGRVYYHTSAKKGVRYYYKVKASNGNSAATSAFSNMAYRTFR